MELIIMIYINIIIELH